MINFMTDDAGRKTHVVIPIDEFARMTDALEDVVDIKEADRVLQLLQSGDEETIPADIARRLLDENPIRVWREYRRMTVRALAASVGISASYLSQIEHGERSGSDPVRAAIAEALDLDRDDIE